MRLRTILTPRLSPQRRRDAVRLAAHGRKIEFEGSTAGLQTALPEDDLRCVALPESRRTGHGHGLRRRQHPHPADNAEVVLADRL
jgi:hypothetical protein